MDIYWGATAKAQKIVLEKYEKYRSKEENVSKRIEKINKVYEKGRYGETQDDDVFVEMTKYIKEER